MSRPENQEQLDKMIHDLAKEEIKNLKNLQKEYQETEPEYSHRIKKVKTS